jgi:hypothetical protein
MEPATASQTFTDVDERLLQTLFENAEFPDQFMILSQASQTYMQAAGEDDGPYCPEYRDGDEDHHFTAGCDLCRRDLKRAFLSYLTGDPRWRPEFRWEPM